MNVLAIDLGTTGVKVAVVDQAARVLAGTGEVLPMIFTDRGGDGGVEQDVENWWQAIGRCSRRAIANAGLAAADVNVIAVTSQYTSTVPVATDGRPVGNAIMWMDARGRRHNPASQAARDPAVRQRWLDVHGMAPSGNDDIGHVAFIRSQQPDVYAAAAAFVEPMDAIAARLTGRVTATQNTMFPMLAMDNRLWGATEYCNELLEISKMELSKLPTLVPLGSRRGSITSAAADHLGVSSHSVVAGATIDSVTSSVGTGAIDATACGLIIGTTSVMATHVASKRLDAQHSLTTAPSPLPGQYFLVAENGIGGKALDVFVNNVVFPDDGLGHAAPLDAFDRVLTAAATVPVGAHGVMFLPWLIGSMAPGGERAMRGGFVNLGLTSTRADMARAVLEGVAMNAAWLLPAFSTLAGNTYAEVSLGGGGAASPLWGQILADCFGVSVRRLANCSTTNAHGAALLALSEADQLCIHDVPSLLTTAQVHEPSTGGHAHYRRTLDAFVDFHQRITPFYDSLNAPKEIPS